MADEYRRMRQLTGSPSEWANSFVVLGDAEIAVERSGNKSKIKLGDGVSTFQQLPYLDVGDAGASNVLLNYVAKGNGLGGLVNSAIADDGTTVTISAALKASTSLTVIGTATFGGAVTANNLTSATQPPGTDNLRVATTAFVKAAVDTGVASGNSTRVAKAGDTMSGKLTVAAGGIDITGTSRFMNEVTAPTAAPTTNNSQVATTAFVQNIAGTIGSNYVKRAGDTVNGKLIVNSSQGIQTTILTATDIVTTNLNITGDGRGITLPPGTIDTRLATTAFVAAAVAAGGGGGGSGGVTGLTPGSVTFGYSDGTLGQDNVNLFWDDTNNNLGIGTNTPEATLHVADGDIIDGSYGSVVSSFVLRQAGGTKSVPTAIESSTGIGHLIAQGYDGTVYHPVGGVSFFTDGAITDTNSSGTMVFSTTSAGSIINTEKMRITSAGDVGIGASSPLAKLHVAGAIKADTSVTVADDPYGSTWDGNFTVPTKNAVYDKIQTLGSGGGIITGLTPGGVTLGKADGTLGQDAANLFWDDANNRLGISTNVPVSRLHVEDGSVLVRRFGVTPSVDMFAAKGTLAAPTAVTGISVVANFSSRAYDGTGYRSVAGINFVTEASPTSLSSPGQIVFQTTPAATTTSVDRMTITSGGSVGIGRTDPQAKLHVVGDAKVDTTLTVADEAYSIAWASSLQVPTKKAVYDKIQAMAAGGGSGLPPGGVVGAVLRKTDAIDGASGWTTSFLSDPDKITLETATAAYTIAIRNNASVKQGLITASTATGFTSDFNEYNFRNLAGTGTWMRITNAGKVGIGKTTVTTHANTFLDVNGDIAVTDHSYIYTPYNGATDTASRRAGIKFDGDVQAINFVTGGNLFGYLNSTGKWGFGKDLSTPSHLITASATYGTAGESSSAIRVTLNAGAGGTYISGYNLESNLTNNAEFIAGSGWTARGASASIAQQKNGEHHWYGNQTTTADAAFTPVERMMLSNSGNLGVGSVNPSSKVTVETSTDSDGFRMNWPVGATGSTGPSIVWAGYTNIATYVTLGQIKTVCSDGSSSYGADMIFNVAGQGAFKERMRIARNGNVGIGTNNPQANIHTVGTSVIGANVGIRVDNTETGGAAEIQFTDTGALTGKIFAGGSTYASYGGIKSLNFMNGGGQFAWYGTGAALMTLSQTADLRVFCNEAIFGRGNTGTLGITTGTTGNTGYITFNNDAGARRGYIGFMAFPNGHISYVNESTGSHMFNSNIIPDIDNARTVGLGASRWAAVYAANGTIQTSDEREKNWRGAANEAEIRAAGRIIDELGFYTWKEGDDQALHFGVRAQAVLQILIDEGLEDPYDYNIPNDVFVIDKPVFKYNFVEFTTWPEVTTMPPPVLPTEDDPDPPQPEPVITPAGNRFGMNLSELSLFISTAQQARMNDLETRLAALEGA